MVSIVFVRGASVTLYAIGGLCLGFYVQHTLTVRAETNFEASVITSVDAALVARESKIIALEKTLDKRSSKNIILT
jgi:hypothetical protein